MNDFTYYLLIVFVVCYMVYRFNKLEEKVLKMIAIIWNPELKTQVKEEDMFK